MTASQNHYFYRSQISDLSRNTVNTYVNKIRVKISNYCEVKIEFKGEIELDEIYFGGKKKGKSKKHRL